MSSRHPKGTRLGVALVAALGALALLALPSIAAAKDRNHDKIPDRWEKRHHLSLTVQQSGRDQDRDHLDNRGEFRVGDNPRDRDSDHDGVMDGDENAGTIASYDTESGKLVINLFGGETISGLVTEDTRIRCRLDRHDIGDDEGGATVSRHGEDGDNSGPGNSGDDPANHDEGDDHGEDPAGHDEGDDHGEDPAGHDAGDDHGEDPAGHDAGDDHGQGDEPGDHHGRHGDNGFNCTPDSLVVGTTVDEAELGLRNGKATFEEIELER
jgi:hypothetical protein